MEKLLLSWKFQQISNQKKGESGFTLLELIVVVLMIGIIAAIAAPGWLGFVNQRRVTAANDVVLRSLQEAQSKAKKEKVSYSVSFRSQANQVPEIAIHRTVAGDGAVIDISSANNVWKSLGQDLAFKPGQVILGTNITGENQGGTGNQINYTLPNAPNLPKITFDHMGVLDKTRTTTPQLPLVIEVAAPAGNSSNNPSSLSRRCVKITTLLGSMQPGRGNDCNP